MPSEASAIRAQSLEAVAAAGVEAVPLDLDLPIERLEFSGRTALLHRRLRRARVCGMRDSSGFSITCRARCERIVYLSTTGVYGDREGAWVDEETPPAPQTARAVRRLAAENALREWADARAVSWCILRVRRNLRTRASAARAAAPRRAGHRSPQEATPTNRIHVEDLATAASPPGRAANADRRIYNVTDGTDDSLTSYLQRVARIGNLPPPPLISRAEAANASRSLAWSFLGESRRVDNRRMREELGVALAYADLDAGIRASL